MSDPSLHYARQIPAEEKFKAYDFSDLTDKGYSIEEHESWKVAERATHPDRTLMKVVKLKGDTRSYFRVFSVVFKDSSTDVEEMFFGDLLP